MNTAINYHILTCATSNVSIKKITFISPTSHIMRTRWKNKWNSIFIRIAVNFSSYSSSCRFFYSSSLFHLNAIQADFLSYARVDFPSCKGEWKIRKHKLWIFCKMKRILLNFIYHRRRVVLLCVYFFSWPKNLNGNKRRQVMNITWIQFIRNAKNWLLSLVWAAFMTVQKAWTNSI